jgi:hypothetical protein
VEVHRKGKTMKRDGDDKRKREEKDNILTLNKVGKEEGEVEQ